MCHAPPNLGFGHIDHGKRQIVRIGGKAGSPLFAVLLPVASLAGLRGQLPQQRQLAFADHPLGIIAIGAEDAAPRAVIIRDRAVGEGVIGLLRIAIPGFAVRKRERRGPYVPRHGCAKARQARPRRPGNRGPAAQARAGQVRAAQARVWLAE
jgi:hypothetical protein